MPTELVKSDEAVPDENWLNDAESQELNKFRAIYQKGGSPTYSLSVKVQQELFVLYLNGKSLTEIASMNAEHVNFGQVVHAAVEGNWYEHRRTYLNDLLSNVGTRVAQVAAEGANFIADSLAVAHMEHGEAMKQYLLTKDKSKLGAFSIDNASQYATAVGLLLKLTGQENNRKISITGNINHTANEQPSSGATAVTLAGLAQAKKALEAAKK